MEISWLLLASTLLLSPFNLSSVAADVEVRLLKLFERYGPVGTLQMAPGLPADHLHGGLLPRRLRVCIVKTLQDHRMVISKMITNIGSKDSSRGFLTNCVISFFHLYLMLHTCVQTFDVTRNLENILKLNMA
jgi:hypothetical protein